MATNGVVTGKLAGTCVITCKIADGGKTATCNVTVQTQTVPVDSVAFLKTTLTMQINDTATLTATVNPSTATNKGVTWKSTVPTVASVDQSGKITALWGGNTDIVCTSADNAQKTGTCHVTVEPLKIELTGPANVESNLATPIAATLTPNLMTELVWEPKPAEAGGRAQQGIRAEYRRRL